MSNSFATSLVAQMVKNLPAMEETWVPSLGWEDPLEKGMATHSCILAWRIPMDRHAWWVTVHGVAESDMTERLSRHTGLQPIRLLCPGISQARILQWVAISFSKGIFLTQG